MADLTERDYGLVIGGENVPGASTYDIVNPATEEVVAQAPEASVDQANAAVEAAAEAFDSWSRTKPEHRAELLDRAADLIDEHAEELIPLVVAETGATLRTTSTIQVPQAAARLRRYAKGALEPTIDPIPPSVMPSTALAPGGLISAAVNRAPVGVVTCITSYNFPMVNMAGKIGPALAMGNPVVVKPAPQDPLGVIRMVELMNEAGFPPGVLNVVVGSDVAPSEAVVGHPLTDMVSFTGSTAVGQRIGAVAGGSNKRLLLELGGKGACIVREDADLKAAIGGISSVWAFHSGQICTAPTRVIVHRSLHDHLVGGLQKAAGHMALGDPNEKTTVMGPLISAAQRDRVEGLMNTGIEQGAEVATGGGHGPMEKGFFFEPTLMVGCTPEMTPVREEFFGPVVVVVPYDDDDEAVAIANDSDYGLYSYVFSGDASKAWGIAKRLRSGNVGINTLQRNHEAPFGGFKQSGVGRDGGSYGLLAYSELQSIVWGS
ncbi:MAG: aldehyde dehydrogenase family protein [Microthrixaceae bacterium]|nr:aldehyde dehydrogenase family protein [Microthrixaceae bacterium]